MKLPSLATLNKAWRPITGALAGLNTFVLPWVFIYLETTDQFNDRIAWFTFYAALCGYFLSIAGFRRSDKHKNADVYRDLEVARMGYDDYNQPRPPRRRKPSIVPNFADDTLYMSNDENDIFTEGERNWER